MLLVVMVGCVVILVVFMTCGCYGGDDSLIAAVTEVATRVMTEIIHMGDSQLRKQSRIEMN